MEANLMNDQLIILAIQAFAAIALAFFGLFTWLAQRNDTIHTALLEMHKEYAAKDMGNAIKVLWDFYKQFDGTAKLKCDEEEGIVRDKMINEVKELIKTHQFDGHSVNESRRLVSHYYLHMADLYFNDILGDHTNADTKKLFFNYWNEQTLRIIPKIIIPIEDTLAESLDLDPDVIGRSRQEDFYRDSKFFP
jgi:hypothetical protein